MVSLEFLFRNLSREIDSDCEIRASMGLPSQLMTFTTEIRKSTLFRKKAYLAREPFLMHEVAFTCLLELNTRKLKPVVLERL